MRRVRGLARTLMTQNPQQPDDSQPRPMPPDYPAASGPQQPRASQVHRRCSPLPPGTTTPALMRRARGLARTLMPQNPQQPDDSQPRPMPPDYPAASGPQQPYGSQPPYGSQTPYGSQQPYGSQ